MSERCAGCGQVGHPPGAGFCHRCGAALAAIEPAASYTPEHLEPLLETPDARRGERKDVAVLFADVAGSLAMSTALDPEDVHAVMNGFFAVANDAIHAEGGRINQYRGDGFMALFGAPQAVGENAARACRAALEIRTRTERYAESVRARFGLPLVLRMGINTGTVWVGSIGTHLREDYTAEGETVGVAARIEALASPGQILVGEETWRRCAPLFEWTELGERALKGLVEPVRVFELLRRGPHGDRLEVERARGLTPLAGRDVELEELARAAAPRPGVRCIEVVGEAGIGKSRLVLEHARSRTDAAVLELRARESSTDRAYAPWLELLRHWPADLPDPAEAAEIAQALEGEGGSGRELEAGLRGLVARLLADRPLLLIVDDAHWLDPSSRRVLRGLAEDPPPGALVLLATLRSGHDGDWGPRDRISFELSPLVEAEARRLALRILDGVDAAHALVDLCVLRGGGHPLFLEEVARALREGPEALRRAAHLEASLWRERERVPETLQNVVAARIDALPSSAKRVLEAACVLAEEFDGELLCELDAEAPSQLPVLVERGLLQHRRPGQYDFCHGVVRDVAYAQLVRSRRCGLHRVVAEALSARPFANAADGAAGIGFHFDRADAPALAAPHLVRAGQLYARLDAPAEAAVQLRRALELLRASHECDPGLETEVALVLATCLNTLDRSQEAGVVLAGIDESHVRDGRLAQALVQTGWVRFSEHNDPGEARELIERGIALAEGPGGQRTLTFGYAYLARILILDGDVREGVRVTRRVVDLATQAGDLAGQILGLYNHTHVLCDAGRLKPAQAAAARASELAGDRDEPLFVSLAELAHGKLLLYEGKPAAALEALERGRRAGEQAGQVGLVYQAKALTGYVHALVGEPDRAHAAFEALREFDVRWPATHLHRARGHLGVGALAEAQSLARDCLAAQPTRLVRARANAVLGLALGLEGAEHDGEAEQLIAESISLCDHLGLRPLEAEAHQFLAEMLREHGVHDRARYYAERARLGYEECGMSLHASVASRAARA